MLQKVLFVVFDGLGDRPIHELDDLTPLEAAQTPNLDELARQSECGVLHTIGRGTRPGSDVAHLSLFGYDPAKYYPGRGPIEAAGVGFKLQDGDVAIRGNLGTVDENLHIRDRRAGRIRKVEPLTAAVDGMEIDGVKFFVKPGTAHRAVVVMRGDGLSADITDNDPHEEGGQAHPVTARTSSTSAARTADVLNKFLAQAHAVLGPHEYNAQRRASGELEANYLLLRGAGQYRHLAPFSERYDLSPCCIAGGGLYKGIGQFLGMAVLDCPGATALPDTDVAAKFKLALQSLDSYDFVFVHVKATDSLGEDGNYIGKRDFITRADAAAGQLLPARPDTLLVITADHSTPCVLHAHSADPVPLLLRGAGVRVDTVSSFSERSCAHGGLGHLVGADLMPRVMDLLGRLPLYGG